MTKKKQKGVLQVPNNARTHSDVSKPAQAGAQDHVAHTEKEKVLPTPKTYVWEAQHSRSLVRLLLNLLNYQLRSGKPYFLPKKGRVGLTCLILA